MALPCKGGLPACLLVPTGPARPLSAAACMHATLCTNVQAAHTQATVRCCSPSLLVVHDALGGGQDDVAELQARLSREACKCTVHMCRGFEDLTRQADAAAACTGAALSLQSIAVNCMRQDYMPRPLPDRASLQPTRGSPDGKAAGGPPTPRCPWRRCRSGGRWRRTCSGDRSAPPQSCRSGGCPQTQTRRCSLRPGWQAWE